MLQELFDRTNVTNTPHGRIRKVPSGGGEWGGGPDKVFYCLNICAVTCGIQQCGILTSVDPDEPVQPAFKLRNSK